jgi:hypothetical protein
VSAEPDVEGLLRELAPQVLSGAMAVAPDAPSARPMAVRRLAGRAYAIWTGDGVLWRSVSLSSDSGVIENLGTPLAFEAPCRAGEKPVDVDDDGDEGPYSLPFHLLGIVGDVLRSLFGFTYEGLYSTTIQIRTSSYGMMIP